MTKPRVGADLTGQNLGSLRSVSFPSLVDISLGLEVVNIVADSLSQVVVFRVSRISLHHAVRI